MTNTIDLLVHITHEAGVKVGGIGAVLDGLLAAPTYHQTVKRSILVGPINEDDPAEIQRLLAPANQLRVLYASPLDVDLLPDDLSLIFHQVEKNYNIEIYYGYRPFGGVRHEVLLLNVAHISPDAVAPFKYHLWDKFGLDCARYSFDREFNRFIDLAEPAYALLYHLTKTISGTRILLSHEWMGMPLVLASMLKDPDLWATVFYAHEVATARLLVEEKPGHDTRFYNALRLALAEGHDIDTVFGDQSDYFKHVLLQLTAHCDGILAVGDLVVEELRFLGEAFQDAAIDLVYNGVPSRTIDLAEKDGSKARLQAYAENLLGFKPDYIFSHVTRFVTSKAIWRDLRVLHHLDENLFDQGKQAVLFILSSFEPSGRNPADVFRWEEDYGWPVKHRQGNGDLLGHEIDFYLQGLAPFNQKSKAIKAVLVNQFGWSRDRCGQRMPAEMNFMDLRKGTDLEFGQSIYEPFGIAQVEPLSFGALCVVSNICGCVGFVERASADLADFPNLIVADYVTTPAAWRFETPADALKIDQYGRDLIEGWQSEIVAAEIGRRLPRNDDDSQRLLDLGQWVGARMSWDVVVQQYLLPALHGAVATSRGKP